MLAVSIAACTAIENKQQKEKGQNAENTNNQIVNEKGQDERNISAWIVYWDTDILGELSRMEKHIGTLCYFAAYFKEDNSLFLPKEVGDTYNKVRQAYGDTRFKSYLTFVNDIRMNDGSSKLKNTELLYRLLGTKESRENHAEDIVSMVLKGGYDGIEIDYEAIRNDITLWKYFSEFAGELYRKASQKGLPVRIVLESNVPTEKVSFPRGPEYVMMCYNLFGYGTEPGPKADKSFLEEMIQKMKVFTNVNFAIATGGFDFGEDNVVTPITEEEAAFKREQYQAKIQRDEESKCAVFRYRDGKGKKHEVWYADKETIKYWSEVIGKEENYGISLWRLGGNITVNP
ncbi:Glycosyl hydrolases family 18 [Anaerocolumna xylanovorans DSM 12503]|uniref:Glycosyl hydrolases family 18 n=2 Tax=Anaerocolumna TaxID=1843210 RepID=A0A1M7YN32_9FIRM|nr:Glycosyl hydrolases family 18 [Anaerocolumna xylanovorans DSM 12503]